MSTTTAITTLPRPSRLCIPLTQHAGPPARFVARIGTTVSRGDLIGAPEQQGSVAVHASHSGRIVGLQRRAVLLGSGLLDADCVIIDTDGFDAPANRIGTRHWPDDTAGRLSAIAAAGIAGLGGAAFPTHLKLGAQPRYPTLILNGAECEPYISCDDMLMRAHPDSVIAGAVIMLDLTQTSQCLIAIEHDKPLALEAMLRAAKARADPRIVIVSLPTLYPAGGERQLVESLLAKEVPSGCYPTDIGVLCQNVGTAHALTRFVTSGEPLISRIVTVTGLGLRVPQNVEVPIGAPISALLDHCGGLSDPQSRLIVGGNMMGRPLPDADYPVTKATNCVLVLPPNATAKSKPEQPCIRCGDCAGACPSRLLPQELLRAARSGRLGALATLGLEDCIECGCCDVVCPSHIPLTAAFVAAKPGLRQHHAHEQLATAADQRHQQHQARRQRDCNEADAQQQALKQPLATDAAARHAVIDAAVARARKQRDDPQRGN
jgi:electron transport complex protein RnfC